MPMSISTFNTNADGIVTAINAGDFTASDVKANTTTIMAHAMPLLKALQNMLADGGKGPRFQPYKGPEFP